jgi:hypothetical protein
VSPDLPTLPGTGPSSDLRERILRSAREAPQATINRSRRSERWARVAAAGLLFAAGSLSLLWPVGASEQEQSSSFVARARAWTEALIEAAAEAAGRRSG